MDDVIALALRIGELVEILDRTIQRVATLEVQMDALHQRLASEEEARQKLPFFQRKRAVSDANPQETP